MKRVISFLSYTFLIVVNAKAFNSLVLNGKLENGTPPITSSKLCVVSFRHNGSHVCSGVYSAECTITTSVKCADKLLEFMCVSKNSITAVSSETGRGIEKVKPLYVPQHGPVDVALVLTGNSIFGSPSGLYMLYSCLNILPECELEVLGWGQTKVPMVKESQIGLMSMKVISLEPSECNIFNYTIDTTYYVCAKTMNDHEKITELDTGSPLIVGGAIAGIISSHIHDSGNYFYFMPSTDIMEILRAANVENICNFFPVPGSEKNDDTQLRLSL